MAQPTRQRHLRPNLYRVSTFCEKRSANLSPRRADNTFNKPRVCLGFMEHEKKKQMEGNS